MNFYIRKEYNRHGKLLNYTQKEYIKFNGNHKPEVTQEELGKVTGLSQPNISKLLSEKNKSCFSLAQLIAIADYFEVSLDSLIGRNLDNVKRLTLTYQTESNSLLIENKKHPIPIKALSVTTKALMAAVIKGLYLFYTLSQYNSKAKAIKPFFNLVLFWYFSCIYRIPVL